jgi:hypothetical protein
MAVEIKPETRPKIDLDKFKEALNEIALTEILPIVIATINSLRELGEFAIATGKLQMKSQKAYDAFQQVGEEPQAFLAILVDKVPQEKLKTLVDLTLKMSLIQLQMSKFNTLSAVDKVTAGETLKAVASELAKLLEEMKT